jgi:hypothetical protein
MALKSHWFCVSPDDLLVRPRRLVGRRRGYAGVWR